MENFTGYTTIHNLKTGDNRHMLNEFTLEKFYRGEIALTGPQWRVFVLICTLCNFNIITNARRYL